MTRAAANDLLNLVRAGFDVDPTQIGHALVATGDLEHDPQPVHEAESPAA